MSESGKSDVTDFVKYLLDGSGAEGLVDYAVLRRDLERTSTSIGSGGSNVLEGLSGIVHVFYCN
jgi:hypothetical protein